MLDIPEEIIKSASLGERILHTKKIPVCDSDGNPQYLLGISEDITDRKKMEEELHLTHFSIEKVSDAVVWIEKNGNIVSANEAACRLLNADKESVLKMSVQSIAKNDSRQNWINFWNDSKLNKSLLNEYSVELIPGYPIQIEILSNYIEYSGKEYVVVFARDISERKQFEEELRKLSRAVQQSSSSIIITDKKGDIEYVNPQFTKVTGYSYNEVIGKNPRIKKSGKTEFSKYEELWKTITSGNEWKGELLNKNKKGEFFWENVSISPVKNENGEITHYLGILDDITDKKLIDEQLRNSLKEKEIMLREIHTG